VKCGLLIKLYNTHDEIAIMSLTRPLVTRKIQGSANSSLMRFMTLNHAFIKFAIKCHYRTVSVNHI
jgi:hypothetical protein